MFLALVLLLAIIVRLRLASVPFERDEGEFAYAGQLMLQGVLPFDSLYNMKMPGIYAAYAVIMAALGSPPAAVHMGLIIVNLATMVLLFLVGRRLLGKEPGMIAAALYGLMSLHFSVQGVFAHATHFVIFFFMAGFLSVLKGVEDCRKDRVFWGGLLIGISFMMKQHAVAFVVYGGLIVCLASPAKDGPEKFSKLPWVAVYLAAASIPFVATCGLMWISGLFDTFWFWTFSYATRYVTMVPIRSGLSALFENLSFIVRSSPIVWLFALIGLLLSIKRRPTGIGINYLMWLLPFSFLAVFPGLHFRPHYFVLILPAISLLAAWGVCGIGNAKHLVLLPAPLEKAWNRFEKCRFGLWRAKSFFPIGILYIALALSAFRFADYYFFDSPPQVSYKTYPAQFFPDSMEISNYLRQHSVATDTIAVLGSEPQIYVYANRHSATGYIYMFPLMEIQEYALEMQKQMAKEIEASRPAFIVFFSSQPSWVVRPQSERWIFAWLEEYRKKYRPVGMVDFISPGNVAYVWGDRAAEYQPVSKIWCIILKRIDTMAKRG